jgi:hypothetical protein
MSLLENSQRITEYRIPADKAEVQLSKDEETYILRLEDETILNDEHQTEDLPDTVSCPECERQTAEQIDNDQLFKCTECGRETVRLK